ncbi:MAG TPA: hypothetical protein VFL17_10425 [Anaerolineae bacterium]|nr:hypothetical protein [Anaerolineae bacterium]
MDELVMHAGIGFVIVYNDENTPLVLGKEGARDLVTGIVTGIDPLRPYSQPDLRAQQLWRVAQFPHADIFPVLNARRGQLDERAQQRNPAPFRETGFPNIGLL